ncbi:hypothetical protein [Polyangium sp. 6x1]|uniref:hypothetical protein n=1 Tax=Polyangium sp. 6x1 TaxID=3042689 RepID=UPI0024828CE8|nr:hypothetical protein [Polyangium sp. 6x1]MDI1448391.1 hypothetical protein [Polyangium sp. 6x1]
MEASLGRFLADMALDPSRLAAFLEDPDALMKKVNLGEEERLVVHSGDAALMSDWLCTERGGPASAPWNCPMLIQ